MSTSEVFNSKKTPTIRRYLEHKCEFSFLVCARQILTTADLKKHKQIFTFMQFFLSVIYGVLYKMDNPFQTSSISSQASLLRRKVQSSFSANISLDIQLGVFLWPGRNFLFFNLFCLGFFGLIGYKSVLFDFSGIPLEALLFLI